MTRSIRRAAFGALLVVLAFAEGPVWPVWSAEVKLATTRPNDTFVKALQSSRYLAQANIKLTLEPVRKDEDVVDSVIKGTADLGLFALSILSHLKFEEQPQLYTLFTRPFVFTSASELLDVEGTPVGAAVLADVSRVGFFPLSFWNRGLSQIWSKSPVYTPEHFNGLTIAESPVRRPDPQYEERKGLFTSLGAKPTLIPPNRIADTMARGAAVLWEPTDNTSTPDASDFSFTIYATGFQPQVGIFASSLKYWTSLSEHDKVAWKRATDDASTASEDQIKAPYICQGIICQCI